MSPESPTMSSSQVGTEVDYGLQGCPLSEDLKCSVRDPRRQDLGGRSHEYPGSNKYRHWSRGK